MLIYILLLTIIFLQGVLISSAKRINNNIFLFLSFLEIVFISGFRESVGGDTEYYIDLFKTISNLPFDQAINYGLEKGFLIFCFLLSRITRNPQILILASSILINGLVFDYIRKNSKNVWLSVYLYITLLYFFNSMNLMRFALSIAILLQSIKYIERRNFLKFLFWVILASSFHFSAVIFVFTYLFGILQINRAKAILAVIFVSLSVFFAQLIVQSVIEFFPRYISYKSSFFGYQGNLANYIIFVIFFLFVLIAILFDDNLNSNADENSLSTNINIWFLICGAGFALAAIKIFIFTRFTIMFTIVAISYLPNLLTVIRNKNNTFIITLGLVTMTLLYTIIVLAYRPEWFMVTPYKNILFQ